MKIIFVSLDTLRASRLSSYGYAKLTSPYLDQVASQGVLFEKAFAADIPTEVAHTGIFTGKVGLTTGVVSHGSDLAYLPKSIKWLPDLMRKNNFTTGAVDNLYHMKEWFARGYRYYINSVGKKRWIDGRTVNDLAKPWLKQHKDDDFFLFLHYWDPHTPYLPPAQYISSFYKSENNPYDPNNKSMEPAFRSLAYPFFKHHHYDMLGPITDVNYMNALYDAEVRYLDDLLLELDQYLAELGIQEETLLVFFGDHGESLNEHEIYWDHCGLYDATVHIPIIMRWPGRIPAGRRATGLIQQVDLMPTLLEAANIEVPSDLDGKSLWPVIEGKAEGTHSQIYLSECAWQAARGIRTEQYKLIRTTDGGLFERPPLELYDVLHDPDEQVNLIASQPEIAKEMEQKLDDWIQNTLNGRTDPMQEQLEICGLPFKKRIEVILSDVGLTWEEWIKNPSKERFDALSLEEKRR